MPNDRDRIPRDPTENQDWNTLYGHYLHSGASQLRNIGVKLPTDKSNLDVWAFTPEQFGRGKEPRLFLGQSGLNKTNANWGFEKNANGKYYSYSSKGGKGDKERVYDLDNEYTFDPVFDQIDIVEPHHVGDMIKFAKTNGIDDPSKLFFYHPKYGIVANRHFSDAFYQDKTATKPDHGN